MNTGRNLPASAVKRFNKNHVIPIRLDDIEYDNITQLSKDIGISKAEVVRRMFWTVRVLFSNQISLKEFMKNVDGIDENLPLADALRNIPELIDMMIKKTFDDKD